VKAVAIIPARLGSTRLPRKPLREISGKPMIQRVYEAARAAEGLAEVIIATDSDEIMRISEQNGWNARLTSADHRSGTDRVHEVASTLDAEVFINVQGDEPLTRPEHLQSLLTLMNDPGILVGTLMVACGAEDVANPSAVKVVSDVNGRALYFSRATIPHDRDGTGIIPYFKHLGFYAYRKTALDRFVTLPESDLERAERLEQLRFLQNGIPIYVAETPFDTVGVDTEEDVRRVEQMLSAR
jgi:3-deoxy-manno-octulosonate cytidylyltransferase (CMP-KDO synthetase)